VDCVQIQSLYPFFEGQHISMKTRFKGSSRTFSQVIARNCLDR
jgi:hypothetical protein